MVSIFPLRLVFVTHFIWWNQGNRRSSIHNGFEFRSLVLGLPNFLNLNSFPLCLVFPLRYFSCFPHYRFLHSVHSLLNYGTFVRLPGTCEMGSMYACQKIGIFFCPSSTIFWEILYRSSVQSSLFLCLMTVRRFLCVCFFGRMNSVVLGLRLLVTFFYLQDFNCQLFLGWRCYEFW